VLAVLVCIALDKAVQDMLLCGDDNEWFLKYNKIIFSFPSFGS
jgi:hypothetical protein